MRGCCIKGRPNENTFPSSFLASLATPHDIIFLRITNNWGLGTSLTLLSDSPIRIQGPLSENQLTATSELELVFLQLSLRLNGDLHRSMRKNSITVT